MSEIMIKDIIIDLIERRQGMKGVDFALEIGRVFPDIDGKKVLDTLTKMAEAGDIIEVEYILPSMKYRVKSFYLPKDTELRIGKNVK